MNIKKVTIFYNVLRSHYNIKLFLFSVMIITADSFWCYCSGSTQDNTKLQGSVGFAVAKRRSEEKKHG